jgi:hypothetical protein
VTSEASQKRQHAAGRSLATLASARLQATPRSWQLISSRILELLHGLNVNARLIDHFLASPPLRERLGEPHATRVHDFRMALR